MKQEIKITHNWTKEPTKNVYGFKWIRCPGQS